MIWGSVQSLFNVSALQTLSTTVCHMQTCWVSFQIAWGALLEVLAGGVWVAALPFPFRGAVVLPAWQGGPAAVPAVKLVLLLTPCRFGNYSVASLAARGAPSHPTDVRLMVDFYELGLWKCRLCSLHSYVPVGGNQRATEKISVLSIPGAFF